MNQKINIKNYEFFVIDYLENNLDNDTKAEFEYFLAQNPDIAEEIFDIADFKLPKNQTTFKNKNQLKKSPVDNLDYDDYLLISKIENTLSAQESKDLQNLLRHNPEKNKDLQIYGKTILQKENIVFPHKAKLKHKPKNVYYIISVLSAAAIAVILLTIGIFTNKSETQIKSPVLISWNSLPELTIPQPESTSTIQNTVYKTVITKTTNVVEKEEPEIIVENRQTDSAFYTENIPVNSIKLCKNTFAEEIICSTNLENPEPVLGFRQKVSSNIQKMNPENVVNFVLKQITTMSESDTKIQVDIDGTNKCYELEINNKKYELCLK